MFALTDNQLPLVYSTFYVGAVWRIIKYVTSTSQYQDSARKRNEVQAWQFQIIDLSTVIGSRHVT